MARALDIAERIDLARRLGVPDAVIASEMGITVRQLQRAFPKKDPAALGAAGLVALAILLYLALR